MLDDALTLGLAMSGVENNGIATKVATALLLTNWFCTLSRVRSSGWKERRKRMKGNVIIEHRYLIYSLCLPLWPFASLPLSNMSPNLSIDIIVSHEYITMQYGGASPFSMPTINTTVEGSATVSSTSFYSIISLKKPHVMSCRVFAVTHSSLPFSDLSGSGLFVLR